MPRWPRPPIPCTATTSPGRAPELRSALNVVMPAQRRGAASAGSSDSGMAATASAGASMYSAYPPSKLKPVTFPLAQVTKSPRRQEGHVPSCPPCQPTPTRCPFFQAVTFPLAQVTKSPRREEGHVPSCPPCQPTPTRCPFFQAVTFPLAQVTKSP